MAALPAPIVENPNASIAGLAGACVTIAIWLAGSLGLDIPPEVAAAATTVVGAAVLYIGRRKPA